MLPVRALALAHRTLDVLRSWTHDLGMATGDKNLGWTADEYSKLAGFDSDWRDSWWNQDYLELLAERLRFEEVERVLDVGCGAGHWGQRVATLLSDDARITGVDHEGGFLDAARVRAEPRPQRFEYLVGSAESLPFDDDTFDLVTCQTVLIHVADARVALEEMLRVVKPGGLLLACEPNNLVNALVKRAALPLAPLDETLRLVLYEATGLRGKAALGAGDSMIGEHLPRLFVELGLEDRRVYKNDQTGCFLPPYATGPERAAIDMLRDAIEAGHASLGGRDTARRQFLAGGGDEAAFDALFALDVERQRRALAAIEAGSYVFGGGFLMYVVSGRKPAGRS